MKINKRGLLKEIEIIIILFIVMMVVICAYWLAGMAGPIVVGEGKSLTSTIQTSFAGADNNGSLNNATNVAVTAANNFLGMVEGVVYLSFIGSLIGFLAVCYYVKSYKWLSMVWIMLMVGLTVVAMMLSNAYQDSAATSTDLTGFYNTWGTNNFLLLNLPYIVAGFGVVSGIILFAISAIGSEEEAVDIN